ncbi:tyrosine-type recombinase/integrase [Streptomonospora litoralis]|uniref:Site-specific tyrosine recombinase XerC n=1 Tax=Streptomonospora litoralis TaxID=2498135 RepID=A0A4P6Q445_9ACTN|nr:tyrosine-type recombinase/integrase [Streptomonospora litoralis]QBI53487.1 site-specific tyrosine recombinase XerC [Streptomonospora litoralis]
MGAKKGRRQKGEGALYLRRDGRWVANVDLGWRGGKRDRREFSGATPEEALDKRRRFLEDRADGFLRPKGRAPTVGEWLRHWLYTIAQTTVAESTYYTSYRGKTERHLIPYYDRIRLTNEVLTEEVVESWHVWLREEQGLGPATVVQCHRILSRALKVAVIRGRLMRNPCSNVSPPAIPERDMDVPDRDEVGDILTAVAGQRMAARWLLALMVGPRQGETLGLTWQCLDIDDPHNAYVAIEWELVRLPWRHGCGDPHRCGAKLHRYPCPDECTRHRHKPTCPADCANARHLCKRPCPDDCTRHRHEPDCRHNCSKRGHVCPTFCEPGCEAHARACPQRVGGGLSLKRPKTAKSRRSIRIDPILAVALQRHRQEQKAERERLGAAWEGWGHTPHHKKCPTGCVAHCGHAPRRKDRVCPGCHTPVKRDQLVFAQPNGRPLNHREDYEQWQQILRDLDLDEYRVHDMRHRAATALLEEGEDVRVVQQILGHANPATTQRFYQHVTDRVSQRAASRMASGLGSWSASQSASLESASDREQGFRGGPDDPS